MKWDLTNSSNILVIDTEESICIPDNILSKNMIRDSSLIRKIKNMILPWRYRRSQRFKMILQEMLSLTK